MLTLRFTGENNRGKRKLNKLTATGEKLHIVDTISTRLVDLNDDCLYDILKHVSIIDLCSLTESCCLLLEVGNEIFKRKHKIYDFSSMCIETVEARRVFQTFGWLIIELEIDLSSHSNAASIMDAVVENCTSLESLTLYTYAIPDGQDKITGMGLFFQKLKKLHLVDVKIKRKSKSWKEMQDGFITPNGNFLDLFTNCDSLTNLTVKDCYDFDIVLFSSTFPKLHHFEYEGTMDSTIGCFALRHKNLKGFNVECYEFMDHIPVLKSVVNFKYLERLRFGMNPKLVHTDTSLKSLERLPYLRELRIHYVGDYTTKLIEVLPKLSSTLEILELQYCYSNSELMSVVVQLKNLRFFRLCDSGEVNDINLIGELKHLAELHLDCLGTKALNPIPIVSRLQNLTKLTLFENEFEMSKQAYMRLVDIVGGRLKARNRVLEIYCRTANDFKDLVLSKTVKVIGFNY